MLSVYDGSCLQWFDMSCILQNSELIVFSPSDYMLSVVQVWLPASCEGSML